MSYSHSHAPQAKRPTIGIAWLTLISHRIADVWAQRRRRAAHRRDLQSLDEYAFRDIGLSHRAAAEWPQARPGDPS